MKPVKADIYNQKSKILNHFVLWTLLLVIVIAVGLVYQNHHSVRQIDAIKRIGNYYDQAHVISDATRDVVILRSGINDIAREHDAEMLLQDVRRLVLVQDHLTKLNQPLSDTAPFYQSMQQLHHEVETLLLKLNAILAYAQPNPQNQTAIPDKLYADYLLAFKTYQVDSEYVIDKLTQSHQFQLNNYKRKYTFIAILTLLAVIFVSLIFYRRMNNMLTANMNLLSLNQQYYDKAEALQLQVKQCQVDLDKLQTIVNATIAAILILRPDETVGFVNKTTEQLLGYRENELLHHSLDDIMSEVNAAQFYDQLMQHQYRGQDGQPTSFEITVLSKAGASIPVSVKISDVYIENERNYQVTIHDISYRKYSDDKLQAAMDELQSKQAELDHEAQIARHVFEKITLTNDKHVSGLKYWSQPMKEFSGDLLLSAKLSDGTIRILLCDFTGHGLPAALGAIPVSFIHHAMAVKCLSLDILMQELNEKLLQLLPTDIFCCIAGVDIDRENNRAQIWNAGLPAVILLDAAGGVKQSFDSSHLPLGVASYEAEEMRCITVELNQGDCFYLHTDGVLDASNQQGEIFGKERIQDCLHQPVDAENSRINTLQVAITEFTDGAEPSDDMTLVEVNALL